MLAVASTRGVIQYFELLLGFVDPLMAKKSRRGADLRGRRGKGTKHLPDTDNGDSDTRGGRGGIKRRKVLLSPFFARKYMQ